MRCYKCQRFGHIAAVCRAKPRCAKCGGEHDYGKCAEGTKIKCCNCGGEHSAAYKGCEEHKKAVQVQNVRAKEKLSYAEAIKKVNSKAKPIARVLSASQPLPQTFVQTPRHNVNDNTLIVDKRKFVAFVVECINCSATVESRTQKTYIIIRAAKKYLGMEDLSFEAINEILTAKVNESQQSCGGGL